MRRAYVSVMWISSARDGPLVSSRCRSTTKDSARLCSTATLSAQSEAETPLRTIESRSWLFALNMDGGIMRLNTSYLVKVLLIATIIFFTLMIVVISH